MPVFVSDAKLGAEKRKAVETALKILSGIIKADGCSFMMKHDDTDEIEIVVSGEETAEVAGRKLGIRVKVGERIAGRSASEKKPFLIVGDISNNKNFTHLKKYEEISSGLSVPAIKNGKVRGVLNAKKSTSKDILTQDNLEVARIIADIIAEEF
ncbi:MAG: GAF domain-containing protein [Elusimicrobiota bacterium]|nr:GAF domain-containing protein [Elusimicrobiota bacterium]